VATLKERFTMKRKVFVVEPTDNKQLPWRTKLQGGKVLRWHKSRATAIRFAIRCAKRRGTISQVLVRGKDGRYKTEFTYPRQSDDPHKKG
jgi:hypothetical protein